jgi:anhydro-N-acetylmuramic acid kinase
MDGVDAAVCRIRGSGARGRLELLGFRRSPWPRPLRERLRALGEGATSAREVCLLHAEVGERFARAAEGALRGVLGEGVRADFAASHGQTVWHEPRRAGRPGATFQIGDPSRIAERLGCPVVSDFRSRDVAAGGQGAPLVPYADWVLFRRRGRVRAVQNLGGIGNVTVVTEELSGVFAFDTGPANLPIDEAVRAVTGGARTLDLDGRRASRGRVNRSVVEELLRHPFLRRRPPRSSGREEFGAVFVVDVRRRWRLRGDDLVATLTAFVAEATADAYRRWVLPRVALDEVLLAGGGARNPVLRERLRELLAPVPVLTLDEAGFPGEAREAAAFAVLGAETLAGVPSSVPAATGARHPSILGSVTP